MRCAHRSEVGEYNAMSLRLGFDYCMAHVSESLVKEEFQSVKNNTSKTTIVFYDFQLTKDGQIERLAAITESGEKFSANLKTAPTSDKPPPARKKYSLASYIFTQHPMSPSLAIERFTTWIKDRHRVNAEGDEDVSNVVLAAHYGSCHHHVYLLRLMSNCDITPPPYRICDTLAIFKMLKGLAVEVTLPALVVRYTAWLRHVYHDPDSDVNALRAVMTAAFPDVRRVCLAFSCSYEFFAKATGLDRYESAIAGFRKRVDGDVEVYSSVGTDDEGATPKLVSETPESRRDTRTPDRRDRRRRRLRP